MNFISIDLVRTNIPNLKQFEAILTSVSEKYSLFFFTPIACFFLPRQDITHNFFFGSICDYFTFLTIRKHINLPKKKFISLELMQRFFYRKKVFPVQKKRF